MRELTLLTLKEKMAFIDHAMRKLDTNDYYLCSMFKRWYKNHIDWDIPGTSFYVLFTFPELAKRIISRLRYQNLTQVSINHADMYADFGPLENIGKTFAAYRQALLIRVESQILREDIRFKTHKG